MLNNFFTKSNKANKPVIYPHDTMDKRLKEGLFILLQLVAIFIFAAFISYDYNDPGWSHTAVNVVPHNAVGVVGAWFADLMLYFFGYLAYFFPAMIVYAGFLVFLNRQKKINYLLLGVKGIGFILALLGGCGLASLHFKAIIIFLPNCSGGILGAILTNSLAILLHSLGTTLLFLSAFLVGITLAIGVSWLAVADNLGALVINIAKFIYFFIKVIVVKGYFKTYIINKLIVIKNFIKNIVTKVIAKCNTKIFKAKTNTIVTIVSKQETRGVAKQSSGFLQTSNKKAKKLVTKKIISSTEKIAELPNMPSITLLEKVDEKQEILQWSKEELTILSHTVEAKLKDFGIVVQVESVHPGPVITRFELQLAPGVKASKITALSKDLARSLSVVSVRVVEVIPGKSVVGLEIPNQHREMVKLRELIESKIYYESKKPLTLALGKDIAGEPIMVDLAKMPHLLVAGTTGAGKSVGLNAMLLSMLYKATAEELRLILIDPKMLELSIYDGIPHLLTPVVTDMKDAAHALKWCVAEMERRYQLMATIGVRNLLSYNKKIVEATLNGKPLFDPFWHKESGDEPPMLTALPYIVVIIDEFADMIMVVGKKVEELIARIAQKARAAGIHLILATQRPSVDVITGLIKANVPARIAFQVSSKIDSRTILDQPGAEQLLGYGDMLYLAPGIGLPKRIHGAFVSDDEVHAVVHALKSTNTNPDYIEILTTNNSCSVNHGDLFDDASEQDPLYDEAVYIVTKSRKATVSNLQRRLKIGYNRAARLVEDMETAGVVSAMQTNGSREVLAPEPIEN